MYLFKRCVHRSSSDSIVWITACFLANKNCIVKWKTDSKWEAMQSECTEDLIEGEMTTQNGRTDLEINTEM